MNICLFMADEMDSARGVSIPAKDERAEHIVKVLHKKAGDTFAAGVIGGASGTGAITAIDSGGVHFTFTAAGDGKPLLPLILAVGFPRPIQLRRLLRDAASLGVCQVHLTPMALGDKSYMKSTLLQKGAAGRMLLEGAAQAASTHAPALFMHQTLRECVNAISENQAALLIAMDNVHPAMTLLDCLKAARERGALPEKGCEGIAAAIAIGAERGWTDDERELFTNSGWTLCSMGSRILRTETAATAAAGIVLSELGYMG